MDRTLSGATTPGQRGSGSDGNEWVICIPQRSSTTEASQSDCLMSYPEHSLGESYSSAEMQSVYSTAPADWASVKFDKLSKIQRSGKIKCKKVVFKVLKYIIDIFS